MNEVLELGTKVVIFSNQNQIDGNYTIGTIDEVYIPSKKISLSKIIYAVVDNEGKSHRGFHGEHFLTIEEYKFPLIVQLENNYDEISKLEEDNENNYEKIRVLKEDNEKILKLLDRIDADMAKHCQNSEIIDKEVSGTQRKLVPNNQK